MEIFSDLPFDLQRGVLSLLNIKHRKKTGFYRPIEIPAILLSETIWFATYTTKREHTDRTLLRIQKRDNASAVQTNIYHRTTGVLTKCVMFQGSAWDWPIVISVYSDVPMLWSARMFS